jgi:tRNA(adenine34) deaminase
MTEDKAISPDAHDWMRRCHELAEEAAANGEAAVGSVITTLDGKFVVEARENVQAACDVTGHAEVEAIRAACLIRRSLDLPDCVLYTTTEPCFLCSYAIRETGIARVVIGKWIEDIGGVTSAYPILTEPVTADWPPPPVIVQMKLD